jgi:hypothetical protein
MSLTTNLVSYWKLDESSGNAADSVGSNTLTNINTVTYAAAKINNGASINSSSNYLGITDASQTGLAITPNLSLSVWVKFNTTPGSGGTRHLVGKYTDNSAVTNPGYAIWLANNGGLGGLILYLTAGGTDTSGHGQSTSYVLWTPTTGIWYHIIATYAAGTQVFTAYINGAAQTLTVISSAAAEIGTNTSKFTLGANDNSGTVRDWLDGALDEVGIWSRVLTSGEASSLYNAGTGLQYPFTVASASHLLTSTGVGS